MKKKKSILLSWKHREKNLQNIRRYHRMKVMFYRTNDLIHSKRVLHLLKEILPIIKDLYPDFDVKKAKILALHHDDYEIVLKGKDIPLQYKLMMNHKELSGLERDEISAIEMLTDYYPKEIRGYNYKELVSHAVYKDCMEAQAVSFADKIDGACEAIHEVLAGNNVFLEAVISYYLKFFSILHQKYSFIDKLFDVKKVWFDYSYVVDVQDFFENGLIGGKPHTIETINRKIGIPQYEKWKEVTIKNFGIEPLIKQVEFHRE
jgi:5'-deoxynucleotidase YfbR-like HD superfamily hydrolase